jgi:hypothetical protein
MMTLKEWADLWQKARKDSDYDCDKVLNIWKKDPSNYYRNAKSWRGIKLGYRRKDLDFKGERKYEKALLDKDFVYFINTKNSKFMKLEVKYNAFPLANAKRGQTITDCLGVLYDIRRERKHPVAIEIKETANNPWFAVVETLQQIRLMRTGVNELEKYFREKISVDTVKGAWGIVLAPDRYYKKKGRAAGAYEAACKLCNYMAKRSRARIIIASINLEMGIIEYKAGYWPR